MSATAPVLLVEDFAPTVESIVRALKAKGYETVHTGKASEALRLFERLEVQLAIVDIVLEYGDGFEVCRGIRAHPKRGRTPVLMLTGETALEKKAKGIEAGADNYLTKPIESAELVLWVEALLRRASGDYSKVQGMAAGELALNPETRAVTSSGKLVSGLTDKEYRILLELFNARPKPATREELIDKLWGGSRTSNTLEFHVNGLRNKLGPQSASHVVTVRGVGYRLE